VAERIDRAARAAQQLNDAGSYEPATAANLIAAAQAHATLALVEQLRVANLITVAGWVIDSTKDDVGYDLDKLRVGVAGEVWEALGLSKDGER
jgi:hypothetical protein